jgi:hemoglobin
VRDIETRADIDQVLRVFYTAAFADDQLGPIFTDVAHMDLEAHLPVIGAFWEKVLLHVDGYRGNAMRVHQDLNRRSALAPEHFERWLTMWDTAVDGLFVGAVATDAKVQAARIAAAMLRNLERDDADGQMPPRSLPLAAP